MTTSEKPRTEVAKHHRKDYTDQEIDAALRAYLFASGHREKAAKALAEQGIHVPESTLYDWATKSKTAQLEVLRQEIGPQIKIQMAEVHQGLAAAAAGIEAKAIIALDQKLDADEIEPKDLSAVMQRSAIATGIHSEKHLLYSGQPTSIVRREASEVLRRLRHRGVVVDGAEEEVEAEVVG